ncbi:MAG: hypothetical protein AB7W16_17185 [Candidatus Obscuribacterales bacterium]
MGFERIAFTALESSYSVASAMKRLPQLAEEAYAGLRSFNIPAGFVDKGGPFHLIAEGGPSAAETSLRLISRVQYPPSPALRPGDTVRAIIGGSGARSGVLGAKTGGLGAESFVLGAKTGGLGAESFALGAKTGGLGAESFVLGAETGGLGAKTGGLGAHVGELYKFATAAESRGFAAVKFDKRIAGVPARLPEEVSEFGGNMLRDSLGFLYSKGKAGSAQIKHLPGFRAVEAGNISFLKGPRPLLPESARSIDLNGELIRANLKSPDGFLYSLASAPKYQFERSPLLSWKPNSIFNPSLGDTNCMACTAGILRTWRTERLTTADDIALAKSFDGKMMGHPFPGRFASEHEAIDWFAEAANVRVRGSRTSELSELVPGKPYALWLNLSADGSKSHMAFAYRFKSGQSLLYDGQNGAQYSARSFGNSSLGRQFIPLEFIK